MKSLAAVSSLVLFQGSYLADIGPAPAVELVDSEAKPFSLGSLRGKVVVVSFVYTTCNGSCPLTTFALDWVRRRFQEEGLWGKSVEFVSITLDPANDNPEALARYARGYRADPRSWHFVTGTPERVARVIASWDMWARANASGAIDHPSRIFLVDQAGRRREIYNLESFKPDAVTKDVRSLLDERTGSR